MDERDNAYKSITDDPNLPDMYKQNREWVEAEYYRRQGAQVYHGYLMQRDAELTGKPVTVEHPDVEWNRQRCAHYFAYLRSEGTEDVFFCQRCLTYKRRPKHGD